MIFGFAAFKKRPMDSAALSTLCRRSSAYLMVFSVSAMSSAYATSASTSSGFLRLPLFLQTQCSWWTNGTTKHITKAYNKQKWSQGVSLKVSSIDREYISVAFGCHYKCWGVLIHSTDSVPNLRRNSISEKNFKHPFFGRQNQMPFKVNEYD